MALVWRINLYRSSYPISRGISMKFFTTYNNTAYEVEIEQIDGITKILLNGKPVMVDFRRLQSNHASYLMNGRSYEAYIQEKQLKIHVTVDHHEFPIELIDELTYNLDKLGIKTKKDIGPKIIQAPMPGLILRILVKEGDLIQANSSVVLIEAMKMENEIKSPQAGVVSKIYVQERQAVEYAANLILIQ